MEIPKIVIKYKHHLLIAALVVLGISWRLMPHLPNFAPVGAIAIMAGMMFRWRRALWLPLAIIVLSDLVIGLYRGFIWTWISLAIIPLAGVLIRHLPLSWRIPLGTVSASLIFFIISNFGVWVTSGMYDHTLAGFVDCYVMALPFLRNTMISDLVFTSLLLTSFEYGTAFMRMIQRHATVRYSSPRYFASVARATERWPVLSDYTCVK